ncbi:DMT family transporter [Rhodobaculum claviforme]|uniref:EamA family transporter n=1 Tax=Rhodobaculum claviforme TaxID=1549854 RepID=A0A934WHM7_9RHOB|nr:DMT family transporter [Rhodobaculum claviforme]MBK5925907.1 EamA family transporter [Rhodobaculum claviforme]
MGAQPHSEPGNISRGILTICAGVAFLVCNDAIAKILTDRYDPVQIIFLRNLIAVPMIVALVLALRGSHALRTRHLWVHALRGGLMLLGAYLYFTSLRFLPLAEATALIFSAPIFITALSVPLLGETVGWRRWGAVLLGFIGVLVIVQPGAEGFQPAALLPVAAAALYALFMVSARWIGPSEGIWTMMLFVVLFPMLYAAPFALWVWTPVRAEDLGLFAAIAVLGSLGITLIGQAFRMAPAAVVAPFDYTALIWAVALGWLIWGDVLAVSTGVGALIIVASGIIIVLREAARPR